jgi:hypothetical protein
MMYETAPTNIATINRKVPGLDASIRESRDRGCRDCVVSVTSDSSQNLGALSQFMIADLGSGTQFEKSRLIRSAPHVATVSAAFAEDLPPMCRTAASRALSEREI